MSHWYMLTLVGEDRPGIVAKVTAALYQGGANLGEAAMMRLGGNFAIMMMVRFEGRGRELEGLLEPVVDSLGLHLHVDRIEGHLHRHVIPDVRVTVFGADRAGIVAQVTGALAEAGMNITDLQSDVGGSEAAPVYIMTIEGQAQEGIEALESALEIVAQEGIEVDIQPIETLIG
ncbi:glycine cleavage system protein R [Thiohalobacter sp.]|uniref:glycine cleavage system protein R n=1 Tax=Thiohalobacter sp. TaxID=2025948 RepID=UPI00262872D0|nr:ACT domain-containing protein [Thiohalobacter sp.]